MKKTDIAMIILIASFSAMISFYVVRNYIFVDIKNGSASVKTIDIIESTVTAPNKEIFNKQAINPVVQIQINGTGSGAAKTSPGNL